MQETTNMTTTTDVNVMTLIDKAVTNNLSPEGMTQLYQLHQQVEADKARRAFFEAKARFKELCPPIVKDRDGLKTKGGAVVSRYATLEHIDDVITPHLIACGLTYDFNTRVDQAGVTVSCIVSHVDGHSKSSDFTAVADGTDLMNKTQKMASAMTFGKRYSLCNALGIIIREEDDDGMGAAPPDAPDHDASQPTTHPRGQRVAPTQVIDLFHMWQAQMKSNGLDFTDPAWVKLVVRCTSLPETSVMKAGLWCRKDLEDVAKEMGVEL